MRSFRQFFAIVLAAIGLAGTAGAQARQPAGVDGQGPLASTVLPGASAAGNYLAGRFAQRRDDWPNSWHLIAAALEDDPDNTELVRQAFLSAVGAARVDEASALAKRIVDFDRQNYFATTFLAVEAFNTGDYAEAKQRLGAMSSRGANRLLVPLLLSWAEAGLGNKDAALAGLKTQAASNPVFLVHGGLIADYLGDPKAAIEWFEQLGSQIRVPGRTALLVGGIYERAGHTERARAYYEDWTKTGADVVIGQLAVDRLARGEPPVKRIDSARAGATEALLDLSGALRQENANDLALLYTQLAAYLRPESAETQLALGDLFAEARRDEEALWYYSQIDRKADLWWTAQLRTADTLERAQRGEEAVALFQGLATEFPDRVDALTLLGDLHRRNKRFEQAIAAYNEALTRVPEVEQRHWPLFYARGVSFERAEKWPEAEKDLLKALELQPYHPQVLNYLAYAWAEQGVNLERAHEMLRRAVNLRPNDGHIIDSLGWVLYRLGRFDEAVEHLEHAIQLEPQEAEVNDHLGDVYWRVGRRLEARFQWRRALQQTTDDKVASAIREKLEHGLAAFGKTAESSGQSR